METKETLILTSNEYNNGYEKGYHSKDFTWEDGIKYTFNKQVPESDDFKMGFSQGQRDRLRDEMQHWMS